VKKRLILNSPSRIHLGFLELNQNSERIFGGLGLTISKFEDIISIQENQKFEVESKNLDIKNKIQDILKIFSNFKKIKKCKIVVKKFIPTHQGLGSGTQLSLSVGFLISKLNNFEMDIKQISQILNRGNRSGIGIEAFESGGFIIDLGKNKKSKNLPLKFLNLKWPKTWKVILIFDNELEGTSGENELKEFNNLKIIGSKFVNQNCNAVLMKVIPGILEKNFEQFSEGIRLVQKNMSKIFYGNSKLYASSKIKIIFSYLDKKGIMGYGQSSWGPTGFVFCKTIKERNELFNGLESYIKLKRFKEISLIKIDGRNKGKILKS
tara:strand:+ start:80 stop:1042 length:963 start_codon:yes stop_codon:yes gene_type:complete